MVYLTLLFAASFALVHLFISRLRFLHVVPRSRWLSAAGGIAVAYVFLHILPELSSHQKTFAEGLGLSGRAAEGWVYLLALTGLITFYGLEQAAKSSRKQISGAKENGRAEMKIFWLHIGSFGLYNVIIGYLLLHREEAGLGSLVFYFIAMALHFMASDFGLRQYHRHRYDRSGRWMLAGAIMAGWTLGMFVELPQIVIGFLFAFLAGSVVLNVLKEELPEERESRFWPFAIGSSAYAALLVAVG